MYKIFPKRLTRVQYVCYLLCLILAVGVFAAIFPSSIANGEKSTASNSLLVLSLIFVSLKILVMDIPRIRSIGWSPWLALLMIVPGMNTIMQILLLILPSESCIPSGSDAVLKDIQQSIKSKRR
jgi:uncharacterized membrane protein YhaH (DUF805 family)